MRLPSRCCFETPSVNQAIMEKILKPTSRLRVKRCYDCKLLRKCTDPFVPCACYQLQKIEKGR